MSNYDLAALGLSRTTAIDEADKVFTGNPSSRHGYVAGWRELSRRVAIVVDSVTDPADAYDALRTINKLLERRPHPPTQDDADLRDGPSSAHQPEST